MTGRWSLCKSRTLFSFFFQRGVSKFNDGMPRKPLSVLVMKPHLEIAPEFLRRSIPPIRDLTTEAQTAPSTEEPVIITQQVSCKRRPRLLVHLSARK